jgi:hypothetical protein
MGLASTQLSILPGVQKRHLGMLSKRPIDVNEFWSHERMIFKIIGISIKILLIQ